jgi:putative flippase GtrA
VSRVRQLLRLPEFVRFIIAGGWNTVVGYGVFSGLYYWLSARIHYFAVIALSSVISVTIAFASHKIFVFRTKGNVLREYLRFYGVYAVPISLSFVLFPFFVEVLRANPYVAQAVIITITVVISYFGHKYVSFAKPRKSPNREP